MDRVWRLLSDGDAVGPWNMGVDEALLAGACRGEGAALRFYAWRGPWLSLGYAQPEQSEVSARCSEAGVGIVRRATGGSAVLHGADLTYAVIAPEAWLPAGLRATYEVLAEALAAGLAAVGVEAERSPAPPRPATREGFECFAGPAADELCAGGRKLVGSAQRRAAGGVLQHGSIRLTPDPEAAARATGLLGAGATSLQELGSPVPRPQLEAQLARAFADVLGVRLEPGELSPDEARLAGGRGSAPARAA